MPDPDQITSEKVAFAFVTMAVAGRTRFTSAEVQAAAFDLMAHCVATLLTDETGEAREKMREKLQTLWAIYEEHDPSENPWDIRSDN